MWDGQIYEVHYAPDPVTGERTDEIVRVTHYGDSALWTGTYLASQSFRYAVAKKHLEHWRSQPDGGTVQVCKGKGKPNPHKCTEEPAPDPRAEPIEFWTAQRDQAKSRIDEMVAQYEILVNISGNWNHEFNPSVEQAGFGGGVLVGEPGYLMRSCRPTESPEYTRWTDEELGPDESGQPRPYTRHKRVYGPLEYEGRTYWCEDGTSRDAYAGVTFGLQTAFDLVSPDDAAMRTQIANDLVTLSNFAFKYLWSTPRPHGRISLPLNSAGLNCNDVNNVLQVCGHDFENFISPLFVITPFARMNMTLGAMHVATATNHPDAAKWQAIFAEELATQGPFLAFSMEVDSTQPYEGYYKHNLSHLIGYNFGARAPSPEIRSLFMQAVGAMDNSTGDDVNAHFEAITYALTGEQRRLDDSITHLREWRDYRTRVESTTTTDNQQFCGQPYPGPDDPVLECVPRDQNDLKPYGSDQVITIPGTNANLRSRYPLPVANRPPTDFLWQRPPNQLNGAQSPMHRTPGLDYLVPYWMIRYHTEVAPPDLAPFPIWPGLTHN